MTRLLKKYWFIAGLVAVFAVTVADNTATIAGAGRWLKDHRGPDTVIVLIFLFSGLLLDSRQIKAGLMDLKGILLAQVVIFVVAPAVAHLLHMAPLETGIKIGIFLVAVMPTTLSSGVVMTGAAGGNMAHALAITILANGLAVITIPVTLALLLKLLGGEAFVSIDKTAIMIKLGLLVLTPLACGLTIKYYAGSRLNHWGSNLQIMNQCLILVIVWMAVSQARHVIISGGEKVGIVLLLVFSFHGILLASAGVVVHLFRIGRGRRESIIFMGGQKTLPLSIILQVSLFPQYGLALVVCVLHHLIQLLMDGYLVGKLQNRPPGYLIL